MNNNWQKGIKDLQEIKLSNEEKTKIMQRVLSRSLFAPVPSTWIARQMVVVKHHLVVFSALFLIVATSGMAFASERSLPGNILYPVKINVTEPARDLIKLAPEAKIEWKADKAVRRLEEAELLFVQNKLDDEKRQKIEVLFDKQVENFKESSEKEIEKIERKYEVQEREENEKEEKNNRENNKEKARKDMEKRLDKLEKDKEKTFKKTKGE